MFATNLGGHFKLNELIYCSKTRERARTKSTGSGSTRHTCQNEAKISCPTWVDANFNFESETSAPPGLPRAQAIPALACGGPEDSSVTRNNTADAIAINHH